MKRESHAEHVHTPSVSKEDFLLQFHRRVHRIKSNTSSRDLLSHLSRAISQGDTQIKELKISEFKKEVRRRNADNGFNQDLLKQEVETKDESYIRFAGKLCKVSTGNVQRRNMSNATNLGIGLSTLSDIIDAQGRNVSTVDKSYFDWKSFKEDEGLVDTMNLQRKDGYITKQRFLNETDERQRTLKKSKRQKL